jgi:uncharacterized delta-60 repeat protein
MRRATTLISVIAIAIGLSCALWMTSASADNGSPITYHSGPVMAGSTDVYAIWYGSWVALSGPNSVDTQTTLSNFMSDIGATPRFGINNTYPGFNGAPSGALIYGGSVNASGAHGVDLDVAAIQSIVSESINFNHLPYDPNGIYIVYASSDIASTATGFCTPNAPPHHGVFQRGNQAIKYAFVGNAARCPNVAAPQFFAPDGSQLPTPTGNLAADAMVNTTLRAVEGTITDPFHTGWFDGFGLESVEKCAGSFSHTFIMANGARANYSTRGGLDNFLVQDNWVNNYGGYCSQYNDAPPRVDDQSVQVIQNTPKSITLTGVDDNGDPMSFSVVTLPQHGTLSATGATRTYTPAANFVGADSFTFKANDGTLDSQSTATVSITVSTTAALDGFDPNANGLVRTAVVQPDGKILIGGDFTTLAPNGRQPVTRSYIARLNIDGTVDPTFNPNTNSSVQAIALQPDGKIIVGGDFSAFAPNGGASTNRPFIARLNADGTVDPTLDPRGNGSVHAVAVQADGGIVIGGEFTGFNPGGGVTITRNRIARLNSNGTLDTNFNPNANAAVDAIVVQPDGRIIIGGKFTLITPIAGLGGWTRNYIARLKVNGTVDDSFDPNADNTVGSIAIQPDGKVLLGGAFEAVGPNDGSPIARKHVARMNVNGTLDTAFNPSPNGFVRSIVVQPDGRILIGGGFTSLTPNGAPLALYKYLARLNADGTLDAGLKPLPNDQIFTIAVQADGKVIAGGAFLSANSFGGQARNRIARLEVDGRVDQTLNLNANGNAVYSTAVQADGKILIAGEFSGILGVTRNRIARLNTDGTLDLTFNPNANGNIQALVIQPDGKIVVGGFFTSFAPGGGASVTRNHIARLNADGTVDTSFNPNAIDSVYALALQSDGKILAGGPFLQFAPPGGGFVNRSHIARINPDGGLDQGFNPNANDIVSTLAVTADGKVLAGGSFTSLAPNNGTSVARNHFARLNADGTVDMPFDPNASDRVAAIAVQPDGKVVVGGFFTTLAPNGGLSITRNHVARLNTDGTVDPAFDPNCDTGVAALALQADGKILISGGFNTFAPNGGSTVVRRWMARLNADGTVDPASDPAPDFVVFAMALQSDGKILAGGSFNSIGGQTRSLFARLANDTPAIQNVAVAPSTVTWTRSGAAPQLSRVVFERSTDGANYTLLGNGTRVGASSDFTLTGQTLPTQQNVYIRARGFYGGGGETGTEASITESVRTVFLPPPLHLAFAQQPTNTPQNGAITPAVTVRILDAANSLVNSTAAVTLDIGTNPASGTLNGTKTVAAVGGTATFNNLSIDKLGNGYTLTASGTNLIGAASNPFNITVNAPSVITAVSGSGQSATINSAFAGALQSKVTDVNGNPIGAVVVTFTAPANGASGAFANNSATTTAATDANGIASASFTAGGTAGLYSVSASINGGAPSTVFSLTNLKANQTVNVTTHAPASAVYNKQFNVAAVSSSGLPISYGSSGSCTNNGATFTMTSGTGICTVKYDQAGDANHNAATAVTETVAAQKAAQAITFDAIADKVFGDSDFAGNASASSGLDVSFAGSGNCTNSGGTIHITGAGSCTITASQAGDANHDSAADVARSFQISKAATMTQLTYSSESGKANEAILAATVSSSAGVPSGAVTFMNDGVPIESCGSLAVTSGAASCVTSTISAGMHTFTAEYSGDGNFNTSTGSVVGGQAGDSIQFSQATFVVAERGGSIAITVKRTGDLSSAASVDYMTDDGSVASVAVPCALANGVALERCDYTRADGTLTFAANETEKSFVVLVNDDSYAEGAETVALKLSNPGGGAVLGPQATATLQITDDPSESLVNPVDDNANFVRQSYHDFLNREPDSDGFNFWTNNIALCDGDGCNERKRVDTSAAFFLSIEFQETGYLVERFYKAAYGDAIGESTLGGPHQLSVPMIRLRDFLHDTQEIGQGVIVNQIGWQQQLENRKQVFAQDFISREAFRNAYPDSLSAEQFVTRLNANAGGVLTNAEIAQFESAFGGPGAVASDRVKRAQVLRSLAENQILQQREFNRAFVLMQYFGYLRRNPNDAQDADYTGYDFWLRKLEQFGGNYLNAEMVRAFIESGEYRKRFGQ